MKYEIGDKISTKTTGRVGVIVHTRKDKFISVKGKTLTTYSYAVDFPGAFSSIWYKSQEISLLDKFEKDFELFFADLMLDINLGLRNFNMVKIYAAMKNNLERGLG
jgi:hypothetical protein